MNCIRRRSIFIAYTLGWSLLIAGCASSPSNTSVTGSDGVLSQEPGSAQGKSPSSAADKNAAVSIEEKNQFTQALAHLSAGELDQAEQILLALKETRIDAPGILANLGIIEEQRGNVAGAKQWYEDAIAIEQSHPVAINNLANILIQEGAFARADTLFRSAFAAAETYPVLLLNAAINNELYLHNKSEALALYERYLAVTASEDSTLITRVAVLKRNLAP